MFDIIDSQYVTDQIAISGHSKARTPTRRRHPFTQKYEGQVHTQSKLRHGMGQYQFDNTFFRYEGEYVQGRKQGQGRLIMQDGTVIDGTFVDD